MFVFVILGKTHHTMLLYPLKFVVAQFIAPANSYQSACHPGGVVPCAIYCATTNGRGCPKEACKKHYKLSGYP